MWARALIVASSCDGTLAVVDLGDFSVLYRTVDDAGNAYVTGTFSDNAFQITPGGTIAEIIDASGVLQGRVPWHPNRDRVGDIDNHNSRTASA